ncbi:MAG: AAA family ATPase [Gammaproteobacteria bacterium]
MPISASAFLSVEETISRLEDCGYIAPRPLAVAIFLAVGMNRPLFLEGEAGVGKTAVAKVLAAALGRPLLRLQCYEGIDLAAAAYDWDYPRQLLTARLRQGDHAPARAEDLYSEQFLLRRPLLQALSPPPGMPTPVLLIDEIDRADAPFEAFLLEFLAEWQISIPEYGTVRAAEPPPTVLTSNRSREVHDALKRRCLYHWVDFPGPRREAEIVRLHHPDISEALTTRIVDFVHRLRELDLHKLPGIAETMDWAAAITRLDRNTLDEQTADETLGALLKYQDDLILARQHGVARLINDEKND